MELFQPIGAYIKRSLLLQGGCSRTEFTITFFTFVATVCGIFAFAKHFLPTYAAIGTYGAFFGLTCASLALASATFRRATQIGLIWFGRSVAILFALINFVGALSIASTISSFGTSDYGAGLGVAVFWALPLLFIIPCMWFICLLPPQQRRVSSNQPKKEVQP